MWKGQRSPLSHLARERHRGRERERVRVWFFVWGVLKFSCKFTIFPSNSNSFHCFPKWVLRFQMICWELLSQSWSIGCILGFMFCWGALRIAGCTLRKTRMRRTWFQRLLWSKESSFNKLFRLLLQSYCSRWLFFRYF